MYWHGSCVGHVAHIVHNDSAQGGSLACTCKSAWGAKGTSLHLILMTHWVLTGCGIVIAQLQKLWRKGWPNWGSEGGGFTRGGGTHQRGSGAGLLDCKTKPSLASYNVHIGSIYYSVSKVSYTSINKDKLGTVAWWEIRDPSKVRILGSDKDRHHHPRWWDMVWVGLGVCLGLGLGWCHVGVTVVILGEWLQCLLGYRCDTGIPFISLGRGIVPHVLSCLSVFIGTIQIVPSSGSGPCGHSWWGCHSELDWCYVWGLRVTVLLVLLRYCLGLSLGTSQCLCGDACLKHSGLVQGQGSTVCQCWVFKLVP